MSLYPDLKPQGVRSHWEHTAMEESGAGRVMRKYGAPEKWGDPIDAVAWFEDDASNHLRVLIADYSNGQRVELRLTRTKWEMGFSAIPELALAQGTS